MKRIPSSFQLGPHEITVTVVSEEEMRAVDPVVPLGLWIRDSNQIYVQKTRKGFCKSSQLHTFWHEFVHAMLDYVGEWELSANERLVDTCGAHLAQAHATFKF